MPEQILSSLKKHLNVGTGKGFTFGTFILIFVSGVFFLFYVSQNYTYLVGRNFRLLSTWGKELCETYENNLESIKCRLNEIQTEKGNLVTSRSVSKPSTVKGPILQGFENISTQRLYFESRASKEKIGTRPIVLNPIQEKLG